MTKTNYTVSLYKQIIAQRTEHLAQWFENSGIPLLTNEQVAAIIRKWRPAMPHEDVPPPDTVSIPQEWFEELEEDSLFLQALKQVGVDSWSGYSEAMELCREWMESENV